LLTVLQVGKLSSWQTSKLANQQAGKLASWQTSKLARRESMELKGSRTLINLIKKMLKKYSTIRIIVTALSVFV
jgi:hypothetical protein